MWAGLCYGLSGTTLATTLVGRVIGVAGRTLNGQVDISVSELPAESCAVARTF